MLSLANELLHIVSIPDYQLEGSILELQQLKSFISQPKPVMCTLKNSLCERVLLGTQNIFKLMGKKMISILCSNLLFIWILDCLL